MKITSRNYVDRLIHDLETRLIDRCIGIEKLATEQNESQRQAVHTASENSRVARDKADAANEKRFDSMNEFRGALSDQTARLLPRAEYEARHDSLAQKMEGMGNTTKEALDAINQRLDRTQGKDQGFRLTGMILYSVVLAAIAILELLWQLFGGKSP